MLLFARMLWAESNGRAYPFPLLLRLTRPSSGCDDLSIATFPKAKQISAGRLHRRVLCISRLRSPSATRNQYHCRSNSLLVNISQKRWSELSFPSFDDRSTRQGGDSVSLD